MSSYQTYAPSGIPWFQELPAHWQVLPVKRSFQRKKEINSGMLCEHRLALTMAGVVPRSIDDLDGLQSSDYEGYQLFEAGDLAFKLIDLQNIKTSRVGLVPERGIMSPAYIRLSPISTVNIRFAYWHFKALYWLQVFNGLGGGVRQTLGPEELLGLPMPIPPVPEQTAIAAFLDRETGKIDALVEEQKRLIELLKEKRQAVISHAVTKGLNPAAAMKDTGIEWLGEVPEHWQVSALKTVATVQTGIAKGKDFSGVETIEVPYLRVANVQDGYFDLAEIATIDIPAEVLDRYRLQQGDVLMNEGGDFDKLGRGHVWDGQIDPCIHQNHVFAVRPHSVLASWLNLVARSDYAQFYFVGRSKQSTNLASISSTNLMELPVTRPPEQEQMQIVEFIHAQIEGIDGLMQQALSAIDLLQERRAALIAAAVTGKIDVRGLAETREAAE